MADSSSVPLLTKCYEADKDTQSKEHKRLKKPDAAWRRQSQSGRGRPEGRKARPERTHPRLWTGSIRRSWRTPMHRTCLPEISRQSCEFKGGATWVKIEITFRAICARMQDQDLRWPQFRQADSQCRPRCHRAHKDTT